MVNLKVARCAKAVNTTAEVSRPHPHLSYMDDYELAPSLLVPTPQYLAPLRINQGGL